MNRKNVVYVALLGLLLGYVSQTQAGVVTVPTTPPNGGGGGTGSGTLPGAWDVYSGSSNRGASAYGGISGSTMGIPDYVQADIDWRYQEPGSGGIGSTAGGNGGLSFVVNFYSSGDVETPNESVNMGTGGGVTLNSVTIEKFEEDGESYIFFAFNEMLRISYSGGYSSYLGNDGWGGGSFYGSASASTGSLVATPRLEFNQFEDSGQEPGWWNDYNAGLQIVGFIPSTDYTMTASVTPVPEPATCGLLSLGIFALLKKERERLRLKYAALRNLIA